MDRITATLDEQDSPTRSHRRRPAYLIAAGSALLALALLVWVFVISTQDQFDISFPKSPSGSVTINHGEDQIGTGEFNSSSSGVESSLTYEQKTEDGESTRLLREDDEQSKLTLPAVLETVPGWQSIVTVESLLALAQAADPLEPMGQRIVAGQEADSFESQYVEFAPLVRAVRPVGELSAEQISAAADWFTANPPRLTIYVGDTNSVIGIALEILPPDNTAPIVIELSFD